MHWRRTSGVFAESVPFRREQRINNLSASPLGGRAVRAAGDESRRPGGGSGTDRAPPPLDMAKGRRSRVRASERTAALAPPPAPATPPSRRDWSGLETRPVRELFFGPLRLLSSPLRLCLLLRPFLLLFVSVVSALAFFASFAATTVDPANRRVVIDTEVRRCSIRKVATRCEISPSTSPSS